ncbi:PP2C family protein-serine/threonine phosphatase [Actinacidiphila acididurans]|uniref:Serine/threonine-protein phosphatase n=1 Tax=Actinacidiphila acididurans TaxID=2784346 RepID=A0ABS2TIC4_9ACTN|nr:PP2C family protein-serine/threonine phosphatase [Actinacidiphila acididurans]MBM9503095.1 serine/threonine-protein phosphatase [Actinacidiphila acididurans]
MAESGEETNRHTRREGWRTGRRALPPAAWPEPPGRARLAVFLLSAALIVGVPVADAFLPGDIHLAHVLVVPVALAAAFAGPRAGAVTALLAVLALTSAGLERHTLGSESVLVEVGSLVLLSVLLVIFARLLARTRRVSDVTQGVVLRPLPRRAGHLSIAAEYLAAESATRVGGDLYAVARTSDATRLLIGDVRGHGLESVGDTETVLGAFRAAAHRQDPLPELVAWLEDSVRWGLAEHAGSGGDAGERFATAAIIEIPDGAPYVHLINCGHPPPLRLRGGQAHYLQAQESAPPLGLGGLADSTYVVSSFDFAPGDRLLLYTDGVTEARDRHGSFYPLLERARVRAADHHPEPLLKAMTADLLAHVSGRLRDDVALVALRRDTADGTG